MPFSFNTALSGLNANSSALGVAGNNIANANTVGFRSGNISFADVYAGTFGVRFNGAGSAIQVGNGVTTSAIRSNFAQGSLTSSDSPTSAAIQGNGFFVVQSPNGSQFYTRAGDFVITNDGHLVTPSGAQVQGYGAVNGAIPTGAQLQSLQIPIGQLSSPTVTTQATFRMNLDAQDRTGAQFHAPMQVFDTQGVSHSLDLAYTRQANGSYLMAATLDGAAVPTSVDGAAASNTPVTFTFDANGQPTAPTTLSIMPVQPLADGANLPSIDINLRQTNADGTPGAFNVTHYASPSAMSSTYQDGSTAGIFSGLQVNGNGTVYAVFSNQRTQIIGQYAVANFNSQEGLSHQGNNLFSETPSSGQPVIGSPGSGGRGDVVGGALEQSNVDLAGEFVNLIVAQRGFQANSRVISTVSQTLQDLLQIL